ncbi:MAG: hypothetical protein AAB730_02230 [Patescibacteria group bacterium]
MKNKQEQEFPYYGDIRREYDDEKRKEEGETIEGEKTTKWKDRLGQVFETTQEFFKEDVPAGVRMLVEIMEKLPGAVAGAGQTVIEKVPEFAANVPEFLRQTPRVAKAIIRSGLIFGILSVGQGILPNVAEAAPDDKDEIEATFDEDRFNYLKDGYLQTLEWEVEVAKARLREENTPEALLSAYADLQNYLEGEHFYQGQNYKVSAPELVRLGVITKEQMPEVRGVLEGAQNILNAIREKAFGAMVEKYPDLKAHAGKTALRGVAREDAEQQGFAPTEEGFLKLCFSRSLRVVNGMNHYLNSEHNKSEIRGDRLTPPVREFLVHYLTRGGFEMGRVGSVKDAKKAVDAILESYWNFLGESGSKAETEKIRKKVLGDAEGKLTNLFEKYPGYKPAPGNIELILLYILGNLPQGEEFMLSRIPTPMPSLEPQKLRIEPLQIKISTAEYPVEKPLPVELRMDTEAVRAFAAGMRDIDWDALGRDLKDVFHTESLREALGGQIQDLKGFIGNGDIAFLDFIDTNGQEASSAFNLKDLLVTKGPKDFEQFMQDHHIKNGEPKNVMVGGKPFTLTATHGQEKMEGKKKSTMIIELRDQNTGYTIVFEAMNEEQPINESGIVTANYGRVAMGTPDGKWGVWGDGRYSFDHENKLVVGDFNLGVRAGENAVFLEGVGVDFFTGFFKYDKVNPSESVLTLRDGGTMKLGEIFKSGGNLWKAYRTFLGALSEQSALEFGARIGPFEAAAKFTKSELASGLLRTKEGLSFEVKNVKAQKKERARGGLTAERFTVGLEKPGVWFVFESNALRLDSDENGTSFTWKANGKEVLRFESTVARDQLLHPSRDPESPAGKVYVALARLWKAVPGLLGKGIEEGKGNVSESLRDVWVRELESILDALPLETTLTVNFGNIFETARGSKTAEEVQELGKGLGLEGSGELTLRTEDFKQIHSFIQRANKLSREQPADEAGVAAKKEAKAQLLREVINFSSLKLTGLPAEIMLKQTVANIIGIEADELREAKRGLLIAWDSKMRGNVNMKDIYAQWTELDENGKLVLAAGLERLGVNPFNKSAETAEVYAVMTSLKIKAGVLIEQKVGDDITVRYGGEIIARVPISELGLSANNMRSIIPMGRIEIGGKIIPSAFLMVDASYKDNVRVSVILQPSFVLPEEGTDIIKPGVMVGAELEFKKELLGVEVEAKVATPDVTVPVVGAWAEAGVRFYDPFFGGEFTVKAVNKLSPWEQVFWKAAYKYPVSETATIQVEAAFDGKTGPRVAVGAAVKL